jgi:Reverse transcriptase (RNA-dependent DNA polymerase)
MDIDAPANYRPLSNLNAISKIIERLALAQLQPQTTDSVNFNKLQSACREHHLTETALLNIINDAYWHTDKSQSTLLVALDLSAAFATVEHSTLLT